MRNRMSIVLMAIAMAACHPRYVPLDERGVGGSGGLDSIRARILACIAARDYDQAREYLKLAANMAEDEQARFEQMISAAERGLVPFFEKALPHIFKATEGHFPQDTAKARELIQTTVTAANFVGSRYGNAVYARTWKLESRFGPGYETERSGKGDMDPKKAYQAVVAFLEDHWQRRPVPGDFGDFCGMCTLMPDGGTYDRAMWWDWLAAIIKVQTGVTFPEPRHRYLGPDMVKPMNPDEAYAAMFAFIEEYWLRVSRPDEIGDLLGRMRYMPGAGTADPEMWKRWLAAVEKVQADP